MSVTSTGIDQQTGISSRIRALAEKNDISIKELAIKVGAKPRTVQNYVLGERSVGTDFLTMLSSQMGVSASWVLTGEGPILLKDTQLGAVSVSGFVQIPKFTVSASAGNGSSNATEDQDGTVAFSETWLKRRNLKPDALSVITVVGDSMEPKLRNDDLILVDRSQSNVVDGKSYVIRIGDDLIVKNVQRIGPTKISLLSANTFYPPRTIDLTVESDNIQIIGRVVASMQEW